MREKDLEAALRRRVVDAGGLCLKWTSPSMTGVPDRIVILPHGYIVFVELKRPGVKDGMSSRQKKVTSQLTMMGVRVQRVCNNLEIEQMMEEYTNAI